MNRLREEGRDRIRLEQLRFAKAAAAATAAASAAPADEAGDLGLDSAVRVEWDDAVATRLGEAASGSRAAQSVSAAQVRFIFSAYGQVAAVTLRSRSALVCFEESAAAEAAISSPPPGFSVERAGAARGKSSSGAGTQVSGSVREPSPGPPIGAGSKRPREGDREDLRQQAPAAAPTAAPSVGQADFASKESDVLARMKVAAAARKQQQQKEAATGAAPGELQHVGASAAAP